MPQRRQLGAGMRLGILTVERRGHRRDRRRGDGVRAGFTAAYPLAQLLDIQIHGAHRFTTFIGSPLSRVHHDHKLTTILRKCLPCSMCRNASAALSSGNVESTIGFGSYHPALAKALDRHGIVSQFTENGLGVLADGGNRIHARIEAHPACPAAASP